MTGVNLASTLGCPMGSVPRAAILLYFDDQPKIERVLLINIKKYENIEDNKENH